MLLHNILVHIANKHRSKIAARCLNQTITYGELDDLSNKLCHMLIKHGVKVGDRVCIYLDKSIDSLISIFGILKAGAIYVPIDPGAPTNRVTSIINDSKPKVIITISTKARKISTYLLGEYLILIYDAIANNALISHRNTTILEWKEIMPSYSGTTSIQPRVIETDSAYILYTSGSTGVPKGVVVTHRSSFVFIEWACEEFRLLPGDIVSNHAPLHFDLSVFDIFATIRSGGTIILIPPQVSLFPNNLAALISKSKINVWYSVPSMLVKMILYGKLEQIDFSNLRLILFAGEVLPVKYLQKLINILPKVTFYNLYGPTETNVCTYYKVDKTDIQNPLPIGKPCPYNRFKLVKSSIQNNNTSFRPKQKTDVQHDASEEGELCIQGPNVMSRYWGIKQSDSKIVEGLYHTGDIVKLNKESNLIYVARIDGMVKTRGYRIELEEIESVLHNHPDIKRSAVVPVPDLENTNLIHAFILGNKNHDSNNQLLNEKIVKNFCSKYLPRYMVPTFITFVEEIPETNNGKVDRIKLQTIAIEQK